MNEKRSLFPTFCHYSKILTFGSVVVLIPFLNWLIMEEGARYSEPVVRHFYGAQVKISGSAKSPPVISIYKGADKVFFAECVGQIASLCNDRKYWMKLHATKHIEAIETQPKFGVIKSITIDADEGPVMEISDIDLAAWIMNKTQTQRRGVYGLLLIFSLSACFLIFCQCLEPKKYLKERNY